MTDVLLRLDIVEVASGGLSIGGQSSQVYGRVEITYDRNVAVAGIGQSFGATPRVLDLPATGFLDVPITTNDDTNVTAGKGFSTLITFRLTLRAIPSAPVIELTRQIQVSSASLVSIPAGATDPATGQLAAKPILLLSQQPDYIPQGSGTTTGNLTIVSTDPNPSDPGTAGSFQINQANGNVWQYS